MPVGSRGPCRRRSWWCHTPLIDSGCPHACEGGRGSDAACRHGLIGDHTVFHVVASCRANPAMVAPSKRNCRIAQRTARTPTRARGAHTEWFCSKNVTVWQVFSRHIQRRIVPPEPHRDPGSRGACHLHHHTPAPLSKSPHNPGSQHSDYRTLCRAPDHTHAERHKPDGNHPNRRADHTDHNDQTTQPSSKQGETPPKDLNDSRGTSPLIIKDLDLYPQPPTNTHSPTPNSEKPKIVDTILSELGYRGASKLAHKNARHSKNRKYDDVN